MSTLAPPNLLTVAEVAEALRVHPETVRRRIADQTIRALAMGRVIRVPRGELERLLAQDVSASTAVDIADRAPTRSSRRPLIPVGSITPDEEKDTR